MSHKVGRSERGGLIEAPVVLPQAFHRGETQVFLQQRHINPISFGPLNGGSPVIHAPKMFQLRKDSIGHHHPQILFPRPGSVHDGAAMPAENFPDKSRTPNP